MASVRIVDGAAIIEAMVAFNPIFLGSTASGEFPPTNTVYSDFSFRPEKGEGGVLVFDSTTYTKTHHIWQYWWEDEKLIVREGFPRPTHEYQFSAELGFSAWCDGSFYATRRPKDRNIDYKLVGMLDLLSYLNGKIDDEELNRRAVKVENVPILEAGIYQLLGELNVTRHNEQYWRLSSSAFEQEVAALKQQVESLDGRRRRAHDAFIATREERDTLLSFTADIDTIAAWMNRLPRIFRKKFRVIDNFLSAMAYIQRERTRLGVAIPHIGKKI